MKKLLVFVLAFAPLFAFSQSVFGKWKTIDDETGREKSIVEIYEKDGKVYGKVVELFRLPSEDQDPICDLCDDDRKGKKVLGMEIIRDLEQDDDEWEDGTIVDPKNGKVYDCALWLDEDDPNKLQVRGYIMFFFRTQTWLRAE
ncbi:MAG: DUF2147 domain-containing protein [Flavobacteriales bacterium]|nr:DUF2147 domain-containing protein [Flavobacteriales bacterium]